MAQRLPTFATLRETYRAQKEWRAKTQRLKEECSIGDFVALLPEFSQVRLGTSRGAGDDAVGGLGTLVPIR